MERNRLLIVTDYQNDFVDGALGFAGAEKLEPAICKKIDEQRACGGDIVFTMDTHLDDYLYTQEGKNLPVEHCIKGSQGWRLYGHVRDYASEYTMLEKNTFGCLALMRYLEHHPPYDEIEFVGLVSNMCVLSNAIVAKTACPEALIVVDARCTAGFDPTLHEKALDVMEALQIRVIGRQ